MCCASRARVHADAGFARCSCAQRVTAAAASVDAAAVTSPRGALLARLARFVPSFHGVAYPRGPAGGAHLRLGDVTAALKLPCVADIKMGFTTGDARFGAAYVAKCAAKDAATTSATLGFRFAGAQHWRPPACGGGVDGSWQVVRADRVACKSLDAAGTRAALHTFCACGDDDEAVLRAVLCGAGGSLLARLRELAAWFDHQTALRFCGASVLLLFDAAPFAARDGAHASPLDAASLRVDLKVTRCLLWKPCCGCVHA